MIQIVEPSAEIISGLSPAEKIEKAARTCYKSEKESTVAERDKFIYGLMKSKHFAMLEHAVFTFLLNKKAAKRLYGLPVLMKFVDVSKIIAFGETRVLVSVNFRTLLEQSVLFYPLMLPVIEEFKDYPLVQKFIRDSSNIYTEKDKIPFDVFPKALRKWIAEADTDDIVLADLSKINGLNFLHISTNLFITLKLVTDRGISHELVRHRIASYAQESSRYCDYNKKGVQVIKPCSFDKFKESDKAVWFNAVQIAADSYENLIKEGLRPQIARSVLPTCLKTEIVVTANVKEWFHILDLRLVGTTGNPHPDMQYLMTKAYPLIKAEIEKYKTFISPEGFKKYDAILKK